MLSIKFKRSRTVEVSDASIAEHTSAADTVAGNGDLLTEILLRLPIRSLLRFKSVSKHWLSLITNPHFSLLRNPHPNPPSGLFLHRSLYHGNPNFEWVPLDDTQNPTNKAPFGSLNSIHDPSGLKILQSCNGLLCCCSFRVHGPKRSYYIHNPTTKQFTTLPRVSTTVYGVNLAFDPSKSPHYKVVCVRGSELVPEHYQIEIYSSDTGPWRVSGRPFTANPNTQFNCGVYWNGAIHWVSPWGDSLYFNVDEERLETMPMPPVRNSRDVRMIKYFGESRDHLHLVQIYERPFSTQFNVYEIERDYSNWFVKFRVDLDEVPTVFPEMIRKLHQWGSGDYAFALLSLVRGEKDEDSFLVLCIPGMAIRYNFVGKTFRKLCDFAPSPRDIEGIDILDSLLLGGWYSAFQYIESLSCV